MAHKLIIGVLFLGLATGGANASPITVSAGHTVTFNFDSSSASLSPPYTQIDIYTSPTNAIGSPTGSWTAYDEIDAGGASYQLGTDLSATSFENISSSSTILDGVFSVALTVLTGSLTVDPSAYAWGDPKYRYYDPMNDFSCYHPPGTPPICDQIATPNLTVLYPSVSIDSVPEPTALVLIGFGLAGIGFTRKRRQL